MKMYELYNAAYSDGRRLWAATLKEIYRQQGTADVAICPVLTARTIEPKKAFAVCCTDQNRIITLGEYENSGEALCAKEHFARMSVIDFCATYIKP